MTAPKGSKTNPLARFACWVCFAADGACLRIDKWGRPFVICNVCGARTFTRTPEAITGLKFTIGLVETALRQIARDPNAHAALRNEAQDYTRVVRAHMMAAHVPDDADASVTSEGTGHEKTAATR